MWQNSKTLETSHGIRRHGERGRAGGVIQDCGGSASLRHRLPQLTDPAQFTTRLHVSLELVSGSRTGLSLESRPPSTSPYTAVSKQPSDNGPVGH